LRRELIFALVVLLALPLVALWAQEEATPGGLLGDKSDGSRAHPIHQIPLVAENEDGERGEQVALDADVVLPFSTKWTCGECHSYNVINHGWHFNALEPNVPPGRPGEPWIYPDHKLGIQIPLSYRDWPGTYKPADIGMTDFEFTKLYGRHFPGGGPGETKATDIDDIGRQYVSGMLEINCLACHNGHFGQDMGGVKGWAVQIAVNQNYRWAAAASCEFAVVTGSAAAMTEAYDPFMPEGDAKEPTVNYVENAFDADGNVLFNIVRESPNERCYYCHSDVFFTDEEGHGHNEKWTAEEDVHVKAGLTCVDCHRNGIEHQIVRGYPGEAADSDNPLAATTTCEGCHLPEGHGVPEAGRLGAPVPEHVGLPPVHFEKMTCTACHSGPWPGTETTLAKTSRAHRLGTPSVNKAKEMLPHIVAPVFAEKDGKISPHKMVWPAFWATEAEGQVSPIAIDVVEKAVGDVFAELEIPENGGWPGISTEQVAQALKALNAAVEGSAVYVAGGSLYRPDANDVAEEADHPAAQPYMWPIAHTVRPAAQSLGVRYCTDCHSNEEGFFLGAVTVDSPLASETKVTREQLTFQGFPRGRTKFFATSFVFRPFFKVVALGSSAIIAVVLLLFALKALGAVARVLAEDE
jgi:hypothetical protein